MKFWALELSIVLSAVDGQRWAGRSESVTK